MLTCSSRLTVLWHNTFTDCMQAHAWVALGKLCLTDEALAKKCVPLFVQQLRAAKAPAVRNNIMVALADLCVQYTALVDTHLPRLAACLTDPNELVRRQALALLANLLQKVSVSLHGCACCLAGIRHLHMWVPDLLCCTVCVTLVHAMDSWVCSQIWI